MKALSLKQPYAELVVSGRKTIELRKWNTNFRGDFLVHASKIPDREAMKKLGFEELPLGRIVGKARLVGVKKYSEEKEFLGDKDKHMVSSEWGSYGFILEDACRIEGAECNGRLNFWEARDVYS